MLVNSFRKVNFLLASLSFTLLSYTLSSSYYFLATKHSLISLRFDELGCVQRLVLGISLNSSVIRLRHIGFEKTDDKSLQGGFCKSSSLRRILYCARRKWFQKYLLILLSSYIAIRNVKRLLFSSYATVLRWGGWVGGSLLTANLLCNHTLISWLGKCTIVGLPFVCTSISFREEQQG